MIKTLIFIELDISNLNLILKIGANVKSREEWLKTNSPISKGIFGTKDDELILVADGTYCYIQKSSNNFFQRMTYTDQKKRHLVKPFVVCATNGKIVDIYGLYPAKKNDAYIMTHVLESDPNLRTLVRRNDVFLLDRGFVGCKDELKEDYGIIAKLPQFIDQGKSQLTTFQANQSRAVTKCRWVVEVTNAFLKTSFRALREVRNKSLPHTLKDYKIAGALINKFFKRIYSDVDTHAFIIANMKKKLKSKRNTLQETVEKCELHKMSNFDKLEDANIVDFPHIESDDLKVHITLGSYQLRQADGYIGDNKSNGRYAILINRDHVPTGRFRILRARIQSRHKNSALYNTYVKYLPTTNNSNGDHRSIKGWYCTCKNGARTLGCCSHVASIIYYFGTVIHAEYFTNPAANLPSIFPATISSSQSTQTSSLKQGAQLPSSQISSQEGETTYTVEDQSD